MRIPRSYPECEESLRNRRKKNDVACGYATVLGKETFSLSGHDLTRYYLKHHGTIVVYYYPDNSYQVQVGQYKTNTTIKRINRALWSTKWSVFRKKYELYWLNALTRDLFPHVDGDRVYHIGNPLIDTNAIYGDVEELGLGYMKALQLMGM